MQQHAHSVFMIRPAHFGFNEQTAGSNVFQQLPEHYTGLSEQAIQEFDGAVAQLRQAGAEVFVFDDDPQVIRPDAVFPNNWISTHSDGTLILYPMFSPNRRLERRKEIVDQLGQTYAISRILDYSGEEARDQYLEGTGSIVFDHEARIAYACRSPRTHEGLLRKLCAEIGYEALVFQSTDPDGKEVYHTNVIMGIATAYAVVCLESIRDIQERQRVISALSGAGKEIIDISWAQTLEFAGNVLELRGKNGASLLAVSAKAFAAFTPIQKERIEKHSNIVALSIPTIETIGGGSVRCMIAQNFLPLHR